jgi:enoyl-CoA hydratase
MSSGSVDGEEILFDSVKGIGYVLLNRPKALNALTHNMCVRLDERLQAWAAAPDIKAVVIEGAGEKAFCAGGDIRVVHDSGKGDGVEARRFFADEYVMNARLAHFPKPYIALLDGIVMGGGVGVSVHGSHRIVTERTLFAMPETGIGLIPDVGGSYFMPRLPGELGMYFGLTGVRLKAADTLYAEIGTHFVPSGKLPGLKKALQDADIGNVKDVDAVLAQFTADPGEPTLPEIRTKIDRIFSAGSVEEIIARLTDDGSEWAIKTRDGLLTKSPTSCKLTFRQLREGAKLDFNDGMRMEYRIVCRIMDGHDFFEGVRAVLIDKDHAPKWKPARLEDVSDAEIAKYFEPLGENELKL